MFRRSQTARSRIVAVALALALGLTACSAKDGDGSKSAAPTSAPTPTAATKAQLSALKLLRASQLPAALGLSNVDQAGPAYVGQPRDTEEDEVPCLERAFGSLYAAQATFGDYDRVRTSFDHTGDPGTPALHQWVMQAAGGTAGDAEALAGRIQLAIAGCLVEESDSKSETLVVRTGYQAQVEGAVIRSGCYSYCGLDVRGYFTTGTYKGRPTHPAHLVALATDGPYVQLIDLRLETSAADAPLKALTRLAATALGQLR